MPRKTLKGAFLRLSISKFSRGEALPRLVLKSGYGPVVCYVLERVFNPKKYLKRLEFIFASLFSIQKEVEEDIEKEPHEVCLLQ